MKVLFDKYSDTGGDEFEYHVETDLNVYGFLINNAIDVSVCSELESMCLFSNISVKNLANSNVSPNERIFKFKKKFKKGDIIFGFFRAFHPDIPCSCTIFEEKDLKNGYNFKENRKRPETDY